MPITPTYPGVYIEEIPSGVRTIVGVATSIAAFIGYFTKGPMDKAVQIFSMADFEREFGGLNINSEASYAIQQFFLNGGSEAWVIRTASGNPCKADVQIQDGIEGITALTVTSISEGIWGNNLRVSIDLNTTDPSNLFNMVVNEYVGSRINRSESFRNLSMNSADENFVETVVNDDRTGSKLVQVNAGNSTLPLPNGTVSGNLAVFPSLTSSSPTVDVTIDTDTASAVLSSVPTTLTQARSILEAAIRKAKPDNTSFASARVEIQDKKYLRVLSGSGNPSNRITFATSASDTTTVVELKLDTLSGATNNVQEYTLGAGTAIGSSAQGDGESGQDGNPPDGSALIGDRASKTGIYALEDVDLFNILCIPRTAIVSGTNLLPSTEAATVISVATSYCEERRAFFLMDTPNDIDETQEIKDWLDE
ncbi:MAG: hypothetical protein JSV84_12990, partial [Gemmatimonadota bacterium]